MATETRTALNLSPREKKAVRDFIKAVRMAYGDKIQRAALFGSKVRGDWTKYSDIDILLITDDDSWTFRRDIIGINSDIELKYDVMLDIRVISETRWEYMKRIQAGLYQNITRDAVPIPFRKLAPVGA
ncbi:MAG: nucleotidyltransferase domain-containing protein [Chloroflexi bacterium]|nr:nucleotidyltransferase domain-containing protein [Chloroflexota bacterium]